MKTKIPFPNSLYQEQKTKQTNKKEKLNSRDSFYIFAFLTLYILSQLSGIYLKLIKGLIEKIKRKK